MTWRVGSIKDGKIGAAVTQTIDGTERIIDLTALAASPSDYPMTVDLQARDEAAYLRQGKSDVALHATAAQNFKLAADGAFTLTVAAAGDGYVAVEAAAGGSGTLVGTRIDKVS